MRAIDTPLFAVEARRSFIHFDILGFNLSYEVGATNILEMLSLAGIPLTWQERFNPGNRDEDKEIISSSSKSMPFCFPLIFAGGQTATSNPEPCADFFTLLL